jgi:hypothetical protein
VATRLFTLEEAQALLPLVQPLLEEIQRAYRELRALAAASEVARRGASGDGNLVASPWEGDGEDEPEQLNKRLREAAAELEARGVELKDPERGLIDFRHERDGEVVYLCFELGEKGIAWWHPLETGFAGRQPM